ncbi:MAG: hypothetical protein IPN95_12590 [Bacteroidetes bacterium]|nr:hypothetical protein [Bacteroidota bacterium]
MDSTFTEIHFVPETEENLLANGGLLDSDTLPRALEVQLKIGTYSHRRHISYKFDLTVDGWEAWVCLDGPGEASYQYRYLLIPFHPENEKFGEVLYVAYNSEECYTENTESWVFDLEGRKEIVTKELVYQLPGGLDDCETATIPIIETTVFHFVNGKFEQGQTEDPTNIHKKMYSIPSMIQRYKEAGFEAMIPAGWE